MKLLLKLVLVFFILFSSHQSKSQDDAFLAWFEQAKLGVFIHWGIYSVDGIDESWTFFNGYILVFCIVTKSIIPTTICF